MGKLGTRIPPLLGALTPADIGAVANAGGATHLRENAGQLQYSGDGATWKDAGTPAHVDPVGRLINL